MVRKRSSSASPQSPPKKGKREKQKIHEKSRKKAQVEELPKKEEAPKEVPEAKPRKKGLFKEKPKKIAQESKKDADDWELLDDEELLSRKQAQEAKKAPQKEAPAKEPKPKKAKAEEKSKKLDPKRRSGRPERSRSRSSSRSRKRSPSRKRKQRKRASTPSPSKSSSSLDSKTPEGLRSDSDSEAKPQVFGPQKPYKAQLGAKARPAGVGLLRALPSFPSTSEKCNRLAEDGYPTPLTASQPTLTPSQARVPAKPGLNSGRSTPKSIEGLLDGSDDDGRPLIPCPDCGRSFKADSLERHKQICKKVFQQKRKQFNSAANRLGEFENASELIANASKIERQKDAPKEVPDKPAKKDKSVPKWKAQSLAFRQAILAAKGSSDPEAAKKAAELQKEINAANLASGGNVMESDMVRCPHCGRTFNKEAGERHIAICLKTFGKKLGRGPPGVQGGGKAGLQSTCPLWP
ncbi:ZC2HC1B [Symbiodinium sp. CCMP2592]|nr:ZC2HC1B [Symbiodinium sp. CCMP2592]